MLLRSLKLMGAGILALITSAAHADFFSEALHRQNRLEAPIKKANLGEYTRANPMLGCFIVGMMQGYNDGLARSIESFDQRAAKLTPAQFERLNLARTYYQNMEATLADGIDAKGCDPQSPQRLKELNPRGVSEAKHLKLAIAITRTISAEDTVIRCLYVGRVAGLNQRLETAIRAGRADASERAAFHAAFRAADRLIAAHHETCGLKQIPQRLRQQIDI